MYEHSCKALCTLPWRSYSAIFTWSTCLAKRTRPTSHLVIQENGEGHTEVLRKVKVDQQSNRRDFILPAVEHLANPWAAMGAMARLCAT